MQFAQFSWSCRCSLFFSVFLWASSGPLVHIGVKAKVIKDSRTTTKWTFVWDCFLDCNSFQGLWTSVFMPNGQDVFWALTQKCKSSTIPWLHLLMMIMWNDWKLQTLLLNGPCGQTVFSICLQCSFRQQLKKQSVLFIASIMSMIFKRLFPQLLFP